MSLPSPGPILSLGALAPTSFCTSASPIVAHRDDRGDRHAALARRAVARADQRVGRELEIGVRQHHRVVLRAAQRLHAFAVFARTSRRCTARSASSRRTTPPRTSGCVEDRVHRLLVAVHDVQHAVGQSRFLEQLRHPHRRSRALSPRASGRTCCRTRSPPDTSTAAPSREN